MYTANNGEEYTSLDSFFFSKVHKNAKHCSIIVVVTETCTYAVWFGGWLWFISKGPPHQLHHGQVDKEILVLRLHHGWTLLPHLLNNMINSGLLRDILYRGQRSGVRGQGPEVKMKMKI